MNKETGTEGQQALDLLRRIAEALERAYPHPAQPAPKDKK